MSPRALRVLRIDDRLPMRSRFIASSPAMVADRPPAGLELITFEVGENAYRGIGNWESALVFWESYTRDLDPDLVVADVRFDRDKSSPLRLGDGPIDIPTGLCHLKPFAAVARAGGRPLGIGLHTADPGIWDDLAKKDDAGYRAMGLLASHEAGELAAILGDSPFPLDPSPRKRIEWGWAWLDHRTRGSFRDACCTAVRDYRRRLLLSARELGLHVNPTAYRRLVEWCQRMQDNGGTLGNLDPGLELVSERTGGRESLSWLSLYSDVSAIELASSPLPRKCFDVGPVEPGSAGISEAWELDASGLPRIGALVFALGYQSRSAETAWQVAASTFPVVLSPSKRLSANLGSSIPRSGEGVLHRGLAVLVQLLRRDKHNNDEWQRLFHFAEWSPRQLCFDLDSVGSQATLSSILSTIVAEFSSHGGEHGIELDQVLVDTEIQFLEGALRRNRQNEWSLAEWFERHLKLLEEFQLIRRENDFDLTVLQQAVPASVRLPDALPDRRFVVGSNQKKYLMETLGYSKRHGPASGDNWHGVARIVNAAFGRPLDEVLELLAEYDSPRWVSDVLAHCAEEYLDWRDRLTWPRYLPS